MPVVPFIPAITAGIGAVGAGLSANAANKGQQRAADASQQASAAAIAEQRRQYDLSRQDQAPWLETGKGALGVLSGLYGLNSGAQQGGAASGGGMDWNGYLSANPDVNREVAAGRFGGGMSPQQAAQLHYQQYGQTEGRAAPGVQMQGGQSDGGMAPFYASPDYNFRLSESMRGLNARNSALGIQDSG